MTDPCFDPFFDPFLTPFPNLVQGTLGENREIPRVLGQDVSAAGALAGDLNESGVDKGVADAFPVRTPQPERAGPGLGARVTVRGSGEPRFRFFRALRRRPCPLAAILIQITSIRWVVM
jgi:hypothetical protein